MSIATEKYLDDPVEIPEPDGSVLELGSTIDSLEEDHQLRLQGEAGELAIGGHDSDHRSPRRSGANFWRPAGPTTRSRVTAGRACRSFPRRC